MAENTNAQLKEKFKEVLEASESFRQMTPEQQAELFRIYENATDKELEVAITAIEKDSTECEKKLTEKARMLKAGLFEAQKSEAKINTAQDRKESEQKADEIIAGL